MAERNEMKRMQAERRGDFDELNADGENKKDVAAAAKAAAATKAAPAPAADSKAAAGGGQ